MERAEGPKIGVCGVWRAREQQAGQWAIGAGPRGVVSPHSVASN